MPNLVGSLDVGTTSSRFIVFDEEAKVICVEQIEFDQLFPHPGWMEERPDEIIDSSVKCIDGAIKKLESQGHSAKDIKTIGITNQRETAIVWDKQTGKPLYNAIVWPDTRNASTVRQLAAQSDKGKDAIKDKCGLPLSTYFAGVKLRWMLDNVEEVKQAHDQDRLMFGTVDTWLLWVLTGGLEGGKFLTDLTNASRTMFMNLETYDWDDELLKFFGVRRSCLAKIVSNSEDFGKLAVSALKGTSITGLIGDQQAALVGNKCLNEGEAKNTYGTGAFMLFNTGSHIVPSQHGLLTTAAFQAGPKSKPKYALEGSIAVAGSSVKWVRDNLGLIKEAHEIGELAAKVKGTGGVMFVTGFSGLFAPYWDDTATGCIIGITGYTTKHHIARATLEATCFQTKAILESMAADSKTEIKSLKVDGGMTNSDITMQIQADILGVEVIRPEMRESTALGAALCAGAAIGFSGWDLNKPETFSRVNTEGAKTFTSEIEASDRKTRYARWQKAVKHASGWNDENLQQRNSSADVTEVKRGD